MTMQEIKYAITDQKDHPAFGFFERYNDRYIEEPMSGCWIWIASQTTAGYGNLTFGGKQYYAHRCAYESVNGLGSADRLVVRHQCDNPPCVNPDHLLVGTIRDNVDDAWRRKRMNPAFGEKASKAVLTELQVMEARALARSGAPFNVITRKFSVGRNAIEAAVTGKTWGHLPGAVDRLDISKAIQKPPIMRGTDFQQAKLTDEQVRKIRLLIAAGESGRYIASLYGVSTATISLIKVGRAWSHVD